ncbi:MAG: transglutaminase-like domain-containing protein [Bacteroidales bacterium]|nr:transglutaminase-like domain-containing protein [Bacteroidales bacterium]
MNTNDRNKELTALIRLLDEPDNEMFDRVRDKIYTFGMDAIQPLENAWENTFDNKTQKRIEDIIHKLQLDHLYLELNNWVHFGFRSLLKGFILVSRFQYPDLDEDKILREINQIKRDVWLEVNEHLTALEKIKIMNHVIYDMHNFKWHRNDMQALSTMFANKVLETRRGNAMSLGIIYMSIAQDLHIPVYGIDLPEHFILGYAREKYDGGVPYVDENDIQFYINPMNKGAVFTRREINIFIKRLRLKPQRSFFYPCDNTVIIRRLMEEMIFAYEKAGMNDKVNELEWLLQAVE